MSKPLLGHTTRKLSRIQRERDAVQKFFFALSDIDDAAKALWSAAYYAEIALPDALLDEIKREARRVDKLAQKVRDSLSDEAAQ